MNVIDNNKPDETPAGSTSQANRAPGNNAKPTIGFLTTDTDARLLIACAVIIDALTGNPLYPAPLPTLASIIVLRDAFALAVAAAKDRGKLAIGRRKQARAQLVMAFRELALYVQRVCGGDPVKLIASGFTAQRRPGKPVGILPPPQNARLTPGRLSGQIIARCDKVDSAVTYQWRFAPAATPTAWTLADAVLKTSFTLEGLARGTDYIAQVRVIGTRGPSDWSDGATLMAV